MNNTFDNLKSRRGTNSIKYDTYPGEYIPLFIADMDFESPTVITEAIQNRLNHGVFGYTKPSDELYDTVIKWFGNEYGFEIKKSWITWLPGVVPALNVACSMVDGDILTNTPNYSMLLLAPKKAGKKRIDSAMIKVDGRFEIDFEDLERKITPETKMFLFCNPHNPVGRVYSKDELLKVRDFCKRHNLIVVSDEIHCELILESKHIPFLTIQENPSAENSITLMSPAKTYNIPAIQVAFAIIPNHDLKKSFEKAAFAMPSPNLFGLEACRAAYAYGNPWKKELLAYLRGNRDYLEDEFGKRFPKLVYTHVEATYLMWLDFSQYGIDNPFEFFYDNAKIVFSNGKDFGDERFVRLNFGCSRKTLEETLDRMENALLNK
jgi:cystathionine beta-lyase